MKRAGRTLGTWFLVLAGTGFLTFTGAGAAYAQPVGTSAVANICTKLTASLTSYAASLKAHPASREALAATAARELTQDAATGSPALKSAVKALVVDIEAGAASPNGLDTQKFFADGNLIDTLACTPSGAPATGGGSSAGLQDPALFGAGGAVVLAGVVVVGVTLRNRSRISARQG